MTKHSVNADTLLEWGREVLLTESRALHGTSSRLGSSFATGINLILGCLEQEGRVIVTGLGKSGHIAAKIAATLASTGTPALFLHASEAMHGDFGMITAKDCIIAIAYGGETREVLAVAKFAKNHQIPVIAITGRVQSSLAHLADCLLDGYVEEEADGLGLAPTSSSTVALGLGDALAVGLMKARGFTPDHFAKLHPGGDLGKRLSTVADYMHPLDELKLIHKEDHFHKVLEAVTASNFGVAPVINQEGLLKGCITDGDLRRALIQSGAETLHLLAKDLMSAHPKTISLNERVMGAVALMEEFRITSLFVVDEGQRLKGMIRLHDLLTHKVI